MEYVINVARRDGLCFDGSPRFLHYCKVEVRNGEAAAREVYDDLCRRFPEAEGFGLSLTVWVKSGNELARTPARDA